MMQRLLQHQVFPAFHSNHMNAHDSAIIPSSGQRLAFTTDSFVVSPRFFPGGNIGTLAAYGTINDLAMSGAEAKHMSCSIIIEEGFGISELKQILDSLGEAAKKEGVHIVTGDTKVVESGKGDGLYINTSGIGFLTHNQVIEPSSIQDGDAIIASGDVGRHGATIMATRHGFEMGDELQSDCASLKSPVKDLLSHNIKVHCMRDFTRGGLATTLCELAEQSGLGMRILEDQVPVCPPVRGICEVLGIDPLYMANEGRFGVILPESEVTGALNILKKYEVSKEAKVIGYVSKALSALSSENSFGATRLLPFLRGEQLPRIC